MNKKGDAMTGYTVHTGATEKYSQGWDEIFKTNRGGKGVAKPTAGKKKKSAAKATGAKKRRGAKK